MSPLGESWMERAEDRLKRIARFVLRRPQPPRVVARHPFDVRHGTDTSGLIPQKRLRSGHPRDAHITAYFGVPPSRFLNAIEHWRAAPDGLPLETFRFVDLGCGKGRALLLASRLPFRECVGVELNPRLAEAAQRNLSRWQAQQPVSTAVRVECGDAVAAAAALLQGPTLLYLYHPFEEPVLRALLAGLVAQQPQIESAVDLLYLHPELEAVFADFPQFQRLWNAPIRLNAEDEGDGLSAMEDMCSLYRLLPASPPPA